MAIDYRQKVVDWAASYIGTKGMAYSGEDEFIKYYNNLMGTSFSVSTTPWCAIFATNAMRRNGIPTSVCGNFASCTTFRDTWLKPKGLWKTRASYTPKKGDLIFFNWSGSSSVLNHVGIVYSVTSSQVIAVEGNAYNGTSVSMVRKKTYSRSSKYIIGYGAIQYESIAGSTTSSVSTATTTSTYVKKFQSWMNVNYKMGLTEDGSFGPASKKAAIKTIQTILNKEYKKKLTVDGSFGPATKAAIIAITLGSKGNLVYVAQGCLYGQGYDPNGFDGSFGAGMRTALGQFQTAKGLTRDYSCGPATWTYLVK